MENRRIKQFEGETGFIQNAYLYQHMDSRGGSTLVLAKSIILAHAIYASGFIGRTIRTDGSDIWATNGDTRYEVDNDEFLMIDSACLDFESCVEVIIIGGPNTIEDGELDQDWGGQYQLGRIQQKDWQGNWGNTDSLVLIHEGKFETEELPAVGDEEEITVIKMPVPDEKLRVVDERFDDDAFSLILMRKAF